MVVYTMCLVTIQCIVYTVNILVVYYTTQCTHWKPFSAFYSNSIH